MTVLCGVGDDDGTRSRSSLPFSFELIKYRIDGKEKKLALRSYPEVGLKEARARRDAARQAAQGGIDPSSVKREARIANRIASDNTFGGIAKEYIAKLEAEGRAEITIAKTRWLLTKLTPFPSVPTTRLAG
jgi:hypothetical protein